MELTEFVSARLDEDEAVARVDLAAMARSSVVIQYDCETQARWNPARVLATVEAHRKIVSLFAPTLDDEMRAAAGEYDETAFRGDRALRALASIWSDHESFDPAWEA